MIFIKIENKSILILKMIGFSHICSFDVDHAGSGGRTPLDGSGGFPGVVLQSGMGYGGQGGGRRESFLYRSDTDDEVVNSPRSISRASSFASEVG